MSDTLTPAKAHDLLRLCLAGINAHRDAQGKPTPLTLGLSVIHGRIMDWSTALRTVPSMLSNPATVEGILADIEHALDLIHRANLDALGAVTTAAPVVPLELATA